MYQQPLNATRVRPGALLTLPSLATVVHSLHRGWPMQLFPLLLHMRLHLRFHSRRQVRLHVLQLQLQVAHLIAEGSLLTRLIDSHGVG